MVAQKSDGGTSLSNEVSVTVPAQTLPKPTFDSDPADGAYVRWHVGAYPNAVTFELHRSTVSGFTPGSNTLVSDEIVSENWNGKVYATGLTVQFGRETRVRTTARCNWARLTYYVMRGVDAGVAGPYSDEQAVTPQAS